MFECVLLCLEQRDFIKKITLLKLVLLSLNFLYYITILLRNIKLNKIKNVRLKLDKKKIEQCNKIISFQQNFAYISGIDKIINMRL